MRRILEAIETAAAVLGFAVALFTALAILFGVLKLLNNIHEAHEYRKSQAAISASVSQPPFAVVSEEN